MSEANVEEDIRKKFESIGWHDSELRGLAISYAGLQSKREERYEVTLRVNLSLPRLSSQPEVFAPVEIRFSQVRFIHTDLDILGMTYCGGDISDARCGENSEFMQRVVPDKVRNFNLPQDRESLGGLRHFGIYLCNPSGEINIVAKDFRLLNM